MFLPGATVDDVAVRLGIPEAMARVALVNGEDAGPERHLSAGDSSRSSAADGRV